MKLFHAIKLEATFRGKNIKPHERTDFQVWYVDRRHHSQTGICEGKLCRTAKLLESPFL